MSYLAAMGAITPDKTPGSSPDLVKTWSKLKEGMRQELGEYRFADQTLQTFFGQRSPMATVQYATAVTAWLVLIGNKMIAAAAGAGRPTAAMTSALTKFKADFATWKKTAADSFSGRLPLATSYAWIDLTDRYAINMSTAQWAAFNNGTPLELWNEALNETPGGAALRGAWNIAQGVTDALAFTAANTGMLLKGALLLGVGFGAYKLYSWLPKRES